MRALYTPFGLWTMCIDKIDIKFVECSAKLRKTLSFCTVTLIDSEDAMLVRVKSQRLSILLNIFKGSLHVRCSGFRFAKLCICASCCIIDEDQQATGVTSLL